MSLVQTSLEAFERGNLSGSFQNYKEEILSFLARNSFSDFTSYEISRALGINILNVRPRLTDLQREGLIQKNVRRRHEFTWRVR
jgi:predicted transcriptional regulator